MSDDGQYKVSPGVRVVDRQGALGGFLGLGHSLVGRKMPIVLVHVVESQAAVGQGIVGIDSDGLIEIVNARIKTFFGELVGVVLALEIEPIGFRIVRRAFRQLLLILCRKLRAQTLRNFPCDITLNRQQVGHLPVILLAPQLFAIANVIEFDVDSEIVAALR